MPKPAGERALAQGTVRSLGKRKRALAKVGRQAASVDSSAERLLRSGCSWVKLGCRE
jgi:hypothetical protein